MLTIGRLCVKTAGRDAMQYCVVIEEIDNNFVLVDGNVRRKRVNKNHLEPLNQVLDVKKGADTKTVLEVLEKAGIEIKKSPESKARTPKPQVKKSNKKKEDSKKEDKKSKTKSDSKSKE